MIHIIFSSFRDKYSYLFTTLLFILSFVSILISLTLYNYYNYNIELLQNEKINRGVEVFIDSDNADKYFKDNTQVEYYFPLFNNQKIKKDNIYVTFNSYNKNDMKLILGDSISSKDEIVISKKYFNYLNLNENNYKKNITFKENNKEIVFKIVGVTEKYDSQIYMDQESFINLFNVKVNKYYVLLKDYKYLEDFNNNMISNNYDSMKYDTTNQIEIDSLKNVQKKYVFIMTIIILLTYVFIFYNIKSYFHLEIKNIAILKALGFRKNKILLIMFFRLFFIVLCDYLFLQLLLVLLFVLKINLFTYDYISIFNLLKYNSLIFTIIIFLICINTIRYKKKLINMNVIEALQEF